MLDVDSTNERLETKQVRFDGGRSFGFGAEYFGRRLPSLDGKSTQSDHRNTLDSPAESYFSSIRGEDPRWSSLTKRNIFERLSLNEPANLSRWNHAGNPDHGERTRSRREKLAAETLKSLISLFKSFRSPTCAGVCPRNNGGGQSFHWMRL